MRQFMWSAADELVPPGFVEVDPFDSDLPAVVLEAMFSDPADRRPSARIESELRTGRLRLLRCALTDPPMQPGGSHIEDPIPLEELAPPQTLGPDELPPPPPPARPVWIRIELVDLEGRPLPDHPFRLQLADGSVRQGTFGETGEIRFDDVTPGPCTLLLPTDDELEWAPTG
jgi:hypothetical protein